MNDNRKELTISAVLENSEVATDFVSNYLEEQGCPVKIRIQMTIAVDEIFSNVARYAYYPSEGSVTLCIASMQNPSAIVLTFIDQGVPYDPLAKDDPDVSKPAEEREIGGLGIFLVKKTMDELTYEYKDGKNILRIQKNLE